MALATVDASKKFKEHGFGLAVVDPLVKFKQRSFMHPRNIEGVYNFKDDHVTQTTHLSGAIFHACVNPDILDPFPNLMSVASYIPEILKEFKMCRQTNRHGMWTVHRSSNQNITCHAHFVAWQVITMQLHLRTSHAVTSSF